MQIADGLVVTIEYTLRDAEGNVLETTAGRGPVSFQLGSRRMLPGLARAMAGMHVGETRTGVIPAGQLVPKELTAVRRVGIDEFPDGVVPNVGERFQAKGAEDSMPLLFEVVQRVGNAVEVRLLHVLHDQDVHYEVKVLAARKSNLPPPPPVDVPDLTAEILED